MWDPSAKAPVGTGRQTSPDMAMLIPPSRTPQPPELLSYRGAWCPNPTCSHFPWFWIYGSCVLNNWNNDHIGSLILEQQPLQTSWRLTILMTSCWEDILSYKQQTPYTSGLKILKPHPTVLEETLDESTMILRFLKTDGGRQKISREEKTWRTLDLIYIYATLHQQQKNTCSLQRCME